ncbi:toprim domain-containing protein [Thauera humireducens]|uniref:toprim domain-containing protein n=1 Tax=Thauera humireducens TaxID=1134435 RepID=UPI0006722406|nr:toprim domain-containing protein [Thauera humireducens]
MIATEFLAFLGSVGLTPVKASIHFPDDKIVRYRSERDGPGKLNAAAVLHTGTRVPFGVAWHWHDWERRYYWQATSNEAMTPAERAELQRQLHAMNKAREEDAARVRAEAAARALKLWSGAKPATDDHPYLRAKGVHAYGLRALRDQLMVPARDADGRLHTLQFIGPDGSKRFLTGGRIAGCYYAIGRPDDALLLAEGYATAATLHQATGRAVAVCFNCGNLIAVARSLRAKFPRLRFVVCADNDAGTPGNPGLKAAHEAARAIGAGVAFPSFEGVAHV